MSAGKGSETGARDLSPGCTHVERMWRKGRSHHNPKAREDGELPPVAGKKRQ